VETVEKPKRLSHRSHRNITIKRSIHVLHKPDNFRSSLQRKTLTVGECLAHPVAWPARGLSLRAIVDRALGRRAIAPKYLVECNSLRMMASLARQGRCIAFQTRIGIEDDLKTRKLVFIPLTDRALPADRLMIVRRPALAKQSAATVFLDQARRYISGLPGD
jgi:DNA-binding transcriptional LysR family regulator